nr:FAD-binding protein [Alphaproteobacteria bacterium]
HGGAWLSFEHIAEADLRTAFGPVIDRLTNNGIDLTRMPIEVSPIAHYHMGGLRVNDALETNVKNLFAAGEAVGGANGANRLSGNAITEAFVFGELAGRLAASASEEVKGVSDTATPFLAVLEETARRPEVGANPTEAIAELQAIMQRDVGPFRTNEGLRRALAAIDQMAANLPSMATGGSLAFNQQRADWFALRNMLDVARVVTTAALGRTESRGSHQREDFPILDNSWTCHQVITQDGHGINLSRAEVRRQNNTKVM